MNASATRAPLTRAFTLIELLVVIVAVTLVVSIVTLGLRPVMLLVAQTRNASRVSQSMKDIIAYAADHAGGLPNPGLPRDIARQNRWHYGEHHYATPELRAAVYPSFRTLWHRGLAQWTGQYHDIWHALEGADAGHDEQVQAYYQNAPPHQRLQFDTRFWYSYTLLSEADIWSDTGPALADADSIWLDHAKYVDYAEISFPALKGVLIYPEPPHGSPGMLVGFADGSAAWLDPAALSDPAYWPTNLPAEPGARRYRFPVMATVDGYRGRDR